MQQMSIAVFRDSIQREILSELKKDRNIRIFKGIKSISSLEKIVFNEDIDIFTFQVSDIEDLDVIKQVIEKFPLLKTVVVGDLNDKIALEYIKSGVVGIFEDILNVGTFKKALRAVCSGEVWFSRRILPLLLEKTRTKTKKEINCRIIGTLTNREREILELVAEGYKNQEIASSLFVTERTIKTHLTRIFEKLGVKDRLNAALFLKQVGKNRY